MEDKQKEIIERIKALHPEISDKSLNEVIEGISGNSNHITTLEITQPLFTLTAEEIDYLKQLLEEEISDLYQTQILYSNTHIWLVKINKANNLLTRIKQWQDENN